MNIICKKLATSCLVISFALFFYNSTYAQEADNAEEDVLTEELEGYFKNSIFKRVKRLEHYISMIANKDIEDDLRKNAIDQAVELFENGDKVVQVSSLTSDGKTSVRDFPVRTYFDRLYAIKASRVDITFYEVTQLTEVRLAPDNKYYATAYVFQDTKIFYDSESDIPDYHDKTEKAIDVSVKPDTVLVGDKPVILYPAKLGNINVKETRSGA